MYNIHETEHQELFFLQVNPLKPIDIHIPSALGTLSHYIYVRVTRAEAALLAGVSSRFDIDGYHEDHLSVAAGEGLKGERAIASKCPDLVWYCLGVAAISRGNGLLQFNDWPGELPVVDLLLCTWPRFVTSGQADDWMELQQ